MEFWLAVVLHAVWIALTVVVFHGTSCVRLTARSEVFSVSGQDCFDVDVFEVWAWKTGWQESSGLL